MGYDPNSSRITGGHREAPGGRLARRVAWHAEAVAVEGYRNGVLTREQVGRLLGLSFWDTEAFLKERQAYLAYTEDDVEQDRRDLGSHRASMIPGCQHPAGTQK